MSRKSVRVNIRGTERVAYLNKSLGQNKWAAQVYVNVGDWRTSVSGILAVNKNGVKRFTPSENSVNSDLL